MSFFVVEDTCKLSSMGSIILQEYDECCCFMLQGNIGCNNWTFCPFQQSSNNLQTAGRDLISPFPWSQKMWAIVAFQITAKSLCMKILEYFFPLKIIG